MTERNKRNEAQICATLPPTLAHWLRARDAALAGCALCGAEHCDCFRSTLMGTTPETPILLDSLLPPIPADQQPTTLNGLAAVTREVTRRRREHQKLADLTPEQIALLDSISNPTQKSDMAYFAELCREHGASAPSSQPCEAEHQQTMRTCKPKGDLGHDDGTNKGIGGVVEGGSSSLRPSPSACRRRLDTLPPGSPKPCEFLGKL